MTRGGTRPIISLAATAFVAVLLVACGGSGSDGSTSTSASSGEAGTQGNGASQKQQKEGTEGNEKGSHETFKSKQHTAAEVSTPLVVSGGGAEQFRVKGGDNSIQEFGEESDESELEAAAETVHDFYVARATGSWEEACSYTSASLREQLEQLAKKSSVKGCGPFLEAFTSELSASQWREITQIDAGSLRRDGEQGFLIYTGADAKTIYAMPLVEEDGEWKVTALSASPLN